jgi:inner membrane transporter RhtA
VRSGGRPADLSPEALFVASGLLLYTGAVIAVGLFDDLPATTVAWLRVAFAAAAVVAVSRRGRRPWTAVDLRAAAIFGVVTALMNISFYLAIERIDLGKSVVMEFIGPIAVAAAFTRTRRNAAALALATFGVIVLSGVEIDTEPLGVFFTLCASALWAGYIVFGKQVAHLDRGLDGLGVGLVIGTLVTAPIGLPGSGPAWFDLRLLALCALVGMLSTAIPYAIDQHVLRRIPVRRFSVLLALLPVTAVLVGFVGLDQNPSAIDLLGTVLVVIGVAIQERDEISTEDDVAAVSA